MSAPDLGPETMELFRHSGAEQHVTLLLGAGASTSSGLPGWDELAIRLLIRSGKVKDRTAAAKLVARQDPLLVAEAARKEPGANWHRSVRAALYDGITELTPSAMHVAAAGHLLSGGRGDTTLLTLNFDTLLESAIRIDDPSTRAVASTDAGQPTDVYVVHHLHGVVSTDEVRDVVLTLSDFNELLGDPESWQLEVVQRAVEEGAVVIAGTSYRDPDLRRWLHVALAKQPKDYSALVLLARQGFELSRLEFDEVKIALADQWRSAGLEPVILEDFTDAAQIIRELRHVHEDGYVAPRLRSRAVWDAHSSRFDLLQVQYADQLLRDASELQDALDVSQLNVTLWLADGDGHLARWAAQDRIYRSLADLRLVDSGHDSSWIAGRALGAETILFQDLPEGGSGRWETVLAVPIRVEHSDLPEFATAGLSVGLPGNATDFEGSSTVWLECLLNIANAWSLRLIESTFSVEAATITT